MVWCRCCSEQEQSTEVTIIIIIIMLTMLLVKPTQRGFETVHSILLLPALSAPLTLKEYTTLVCSVLVLYILQFGVLLVCNVNFTGVGVSHFNMVHHHTLGIKRPGQVDGL